MDFLGSPLYCSTVFNQGENGVKSLRPKLLNPIFGAINSSSAMKIVYS